MKYYQSFFCVLIYTVTLVCLYSVDKANKALFRLFFKMIYSSGFMAGFPIGESCVIILQGCLPTRNLYDKNVDIDIV